MLNAEKYGEEIKSAALAFNCEVPNEAEVKKLYDDYVYAHKLIVHNGEGIEVEISRDPKTGGRTITMDYGPRSSDVPGLVYRVF